MTAAPKGARSRGPGFGRPTTCREIGGAGYEVRLPQNRRPLFPRRQGMGYVVHGLVISVPTQDDKSPNHLHLPGANERPECRATAPRPAGHCLNQRPVRLGVTGKTAGRSSVQVQSRQKGCRCFGFQRWWRLDQCGAEALKPIPFQRPGWAHLAPGAAFVTPPSRAPAVELAKTRSERKVPKREQASHLAGDYMWGKREDRPRWRDGKPLGIESQRYRYMQPSPCLRGCDPR